MKMEMNFSGKKVLVTGGTRGIGAAIAVGFYNGGAAVAVTGTSKKSAEDFYKNHPQKEIRFIELDFSNLEASQKAVAQIASETFDILVNNAGINKIDFLEEIQLEDWQRIQNVNLRGPYLLSKALVPAMKTKKWGRILNISSIFGVVSKEKRLSYSTSKAGLIGMTKNMALELAESNILVNSVSPGFIDTELTRNVLGEKGILEMVSKVPLKRLGRPEDVANLVMFLASPLNNFISGENIIIDGGFTCA